MYLLRLVFLILIVKSNNPLTRALFLVLSLVSVAPILALMWQVWYMYLLLMIFLSGVLIIVVYFARLGVYTYKKVLGITLMFGLVIMFYPFIIHFISNYNVFVVFTRQNIIIIIYIVFILFSLILFVSYFVRTTVAIRRL